MQGKELTLAVGFANPVKRAIPRADGYGPAPTQIVIQGPDKQKVGEFAAVVRRVSPPDRTRAGSGTRASGKHKAGKAFVATE